MVDGGVIDSEGGLFLSYGGIWSGKRIIVGIGWVDLLR